MLGAKFRSFSEYDVLAIGGSAGCLEVLLKIFPHIPDNFPIPILLVIHRKSSVSSQLEDILNKYTTLTVKEADDKEFLSPGFIYMAPAGYHVLIENDTSISLDSSEEVNHSRPSIDVTFQSVADVYGARAIGLILSGASKDGASGLKSISEQGGYVIVQEPESAQNETMPWAALELISSDNVMKIDEMITLMSSN